MRNEYYFSNSNRNVYAEKGTKQFNVKKYVPLENIKLETMYGLSQEQMLKVASCTLAVMMMAMLQACRTHANC